MTHELHELHEELIKYSLDYNTIADTKERLIMKLRKGKAEISRL